MLSDEFLSFVFKEGECIYLLIANEQVLERIGQTISYIEKPIELVIFWQELASFMMLLKGR